MNTQQSGQQIFEVRPPPGCENDIQPSSLLSSETRGWGGVQVYKYELPAQPRPIDVITPNAHSLQLVLSGSGETSSHVKAQVLRANTQAGSLNLVPCGMPATFSWTHRCVMAHFKFPPTLFLNLLATFNLEKPEPLTLLPKVFFRDTFLEQNCCALLAELESGGLMGTLYADALAQVLALHLLRNYSTLTPAKALPGGGLSQQQLSKVTDFIEDCLVTDISLEHLASLTGLNPLCFSKQFKAATGLPPHQYVILRRVERARELLSSDSSIAEISQIVGFFDQSHLVRHFKYWVGVTPRDYRERQVRLAATGARGSSEPAKTGLANSF
jgi:AraC family transcriptional regulator